MKLAKLRPTPTWARVMTIGATSGFGLALLYGQLFAAYAIVRSTWEIVTTVPSEMNLFGPLLANAMSITLATTASSLLLSPITALLGLTTAALINGLQRTLNKQQATDRAILIALAVSLGTIFALQFTIRQLTGQPLANLGLATYLFWLGLPAIVHSSAAIVGAWFLNHDNHPLTQSHKGVHHDPTQLHSRAI